MSEAFRIHGIVAKAGTIQAPDLPFVEGESVEFVIWRSSDVVEDSNPSKEEIARRLQGLAEMGDWFDRNRPTDTPYIPDEALRRENLYDDFGR